MSRGPAVTCRPIGHDWPAPLRRQRQRARFSAGWTDTMELLAREARQLAARHITIRLALSDGDIRLDGWPRAAARPEHPGAMVVLPDSREGRLSWHTDIYDRWQDNVRAIAKTMEALRAADRHGVMAGRQYAGFRELTSGGAGEPTSVEEAARFIADHAGHAESWELLRDDTTEGQRVVARSYRLAAQRLHPDAGGDADQFRRLQAAFDLLTQEAAHG